MYEWRLFMLFFQLHLQKESCAFLTNCISRKICLAIVTTQTAKSYQMSTENFGLQVFAPAEESCFYSVRTFLCNAHPSTSVSYVPRKLWQHHVDLQEEILTTLQVIYGLDCINIKASLLCKQLYINKIIELLS